MPARSPRRGAGVTLADPDRAARPDLDQIVAWPFILSMPRPLQRRTVVAAVRLQECEIPVLRAWHGPALSPTALRSSALIRFAALAGSQRCPPLAPCHKQIHTSHPA